MAIQLSNLEHLPNYQITERLDVVYGSTVRSKHVGKDLFAGIKNIVGGELTAYTELLEESRKEAVDRMIVKAEALGADAVVGLRFSTSSIAQGAAELFVYGTAVKVMRLPNPSAPHPPFQNQPPTEPFNQQQEQSTKTPTEDLPRFNPFG